MAALLVGREGEEEGRRFPLQTDAHTRILNINTQKIIYICDGRCKNCILFKFTHTLFYPLFILKEH